VLDTIRLAIAAQHVRHLQGGPLHGKKRLKVLGRGCRLRWWQRVRQQIQWARGRTDLRDGDTQVACRCRQRSVSHQQLDRAQVLPGLQQMTRKGVSKRMGCDGFGQATALLNLVTRLDNRIWSDVLTRHTARKQPI
jgi:hypothetical protein